MTTLHIFRNVPDDRVLELVREMIPDETTQIAIYEEIVDYDQLVSAIFTHDRIVSWW